MIYELINPVLLLTSILTCLYIFIFKTRRRLPPGPWGIPIIGNIFDVNKDTLLEDFRKLRHKYGDIYTVRFGSHRMIMVNGYETLQEVFHKRGDEFAARPDTFFAVDLCRKSGIANSSGPQWKEQRQFALSKLRTVGFSKRSHESKIMEEVDIFLRILDETNGEPTDTKEFLTNCLSNVICNLTLGKRFEHNDPDFKTLLAGFQTNFKHLNKLEFVEIFPLVKYLPGDIFKRKEMLRNAQGFLDLMMSYVNEHKRVFDDNNIHDFMDCYIKELKKRKAPSPLFNESQLLHTVGDFFVAGTDTTTTILQWAILFLLHNPDVQNKLQTEMDTVVGVSRCPTLSDRTSLPYMEAFLAEVLRLGDVACLCLPHSNPCDVTINGYFIPSGSCIIPNINSVHSDPELFPNPEQFDPSRFIDENGRYKGSEFLMAFGLGRRICPGEIFARSELFLFTAAVVQRFTFEPVDVENLPSLKASMELIRHPVDYTFKAIKRDMSCDTSCDVH